MRTGQASRATHRGHARAFAAARLGQSGVAPQALRLVNYRRRAYTKKKSQPKTTQKDRYMPELLYVPETATQSEIVDYLDRLQLGDMLVIDGRVIGLIAYSVDAISGKRDVERDRRFFALIDSLLTDPESPVRTPEAAARYIVEQGAVPGDAPSEWKAQRIAALYRKNRKITPERRSEIARNNSNKRWSKRTNC